MANYLRRSWQIKPGFGAQINHGHVLARGLQRYWLFNEGSGECTDLVLGRKMARVGATNGSWAGLVHDHDNPSGGDHNTGIDRIGYSMTGGVGADRLTSDDDYRTRITTGVTIMWRGRYTDNSSAPGSTGMFCNGQGTGLGYNWLLTDGTSATSQVSFFLKTSGAGSFSTVDSGLALGGTGFFTYIGRYDGANINVFRNGDKGTTTAKTGNVDTTDLDTVLGSWNTVGNVSTVSTAAIWNVALSDPEIWSLTKEPWSMVGPPSPSIFYSIPAGGGGGSTHPGWLSSRGGWR